MKGSAVEGPEAEGESVRVREGRANGRSATGNVEITGERRRTEKWVGFRFMLLRIILLDRKV